MQETQIKKIQPQVWVGALGRRILQKIRKLLQGLLN